MSKEQNGGPAFPSPMQDDRDCHARNESGYGGLSVRDWFAGQALAGLMANPHPQAISLTAEEKTGVAFTQADSVLKARKQ